MGHSSGGGYGTSPASVSVLFDNIERWSNNGWPLDSEGRFGTKTSDAASEIITDTPFETARSFFEALGRGGNPATRMTKNGRVEMRVFQGGSRINYREATTSSRRRNEDNPGVDIRITVAGPRYPGGYTIHFRRRRAGE